MKSHTYGLQKKNDMVVEEEEDTSIVVEYE